MTEQHCSPRRTQDRICHSGCQVERTSVIVPFPVALSEPGEYPSLRRCNSNSSFRSSRGKETHHQFLPSMKLFFRDTHIPGADWGLSESPSLHQSQLAQLCTPLSGSQPSLAAYPPNRCCAPLVQAEAQERQQRLLPRHPEIREQPATVHAAQNHCPGCSLRHF